MLKFGDNEYLKELEKYVLMLPKKRQTIVRRKLKRILKYNSKLPKEKTYLEARAGQVLKYRKKASKQRVQHATEIANLFNENPTKNVESLKEFEHY